MSLAILTASCSSSAGMTLRTGPKISSWAMVERVVDVAEHGRLDVPAALEVLGAPATGGERRALVDPLGDVALDAVALTFRRERTHLRRRLERVADLHLGEGAGQHVDELVVTGSRHHDPGQRGADLTREEAFGSRDGLRDAREVRVVEDHRGRLAAELERAAGDALAAERRDASTGRRRPGERDLVDAGVRDEQLGDSRSAVRR